MLYGSFKTDSSFEDPYIPGSDHEVKFEGFEPTPEKSKTFRRSYFYVAIIAASMIISIGYSFGYLKPIVFNNSINLLESLNSETSTATISVTTEYGDNSINMFPYPFLEDAVLMEPHRENNVFITQTVSVCPDNRVLESSSCNVNWSLLGTDGEISVSGCSLGPSFAVTPLMTGQHSLLVQRTCADNSLVEVGTFKVWVKYVRRELQTLSENDRNEFLDAMRTLWDVSTLDGQKLYGERYKSLWYLATVHNDGGSSPVCDEFHASNGFVNNHVLLGSYLEQSLQLVNPRVALHYLEYAALFSSENFQSHIDNQLDGGAWTEIMTEKFFGSNDPLTGKILDGRWANSAVPYMDEAFFVKEGLQNKLTFFPEEEEIWLGVSSAHRMSPYGLLRSPWNYNPSPYTTRYNNVDRILNSDSISLRQWGLYLGSTCTDYSNFVTEDVYHKDLKNYLAFAEDQVHGNIHFAFGGSGGDNCAEIDDVLRTKYEFSDSDLLIVAQAAQTFFKTYLPFQNVFVHPTFGNPLSCSADPWQNGQLTSTAAPGDTDGPSCTCAPAYLENEETFQTLVKMYFMKFINDNTEVVQYLQDNKIDFDERKTVMNLLCGRMQFDGDMAGSGAASDPLFWVAHGAIERLFQRVLFENILTDKVYGVGNGRMDTCSGHTVEGTKMWLKGLYFDGASEDASLLTNVDFTEILDPTTEKYRDNINYVYDDSTWSFCEGSESWFSGKSSVTAFAQHPQMK